MFFAITQKVLLWAVCNCYSHLQSLKVPHEPIFIKNRGDEAEGVRPGLICRGRSHRQDKDPLDGFFDPPFPSSIPGRPRTYLLVYYSGLSRDCLTPDSETGFASYRTSTFASDWEDMRLVIFAVLMVRSVAYLRGGHWDMSPPLGRRRRPHEVKAPHRRHAPKAPKAPSVHDAPRVSVKTAHEGAIRHMRTTFLGPGAPS